MSVPARRRAVVAMIGLALVAGACGQSTSAKSSTPAASSSGGSTTSPTGGLSSSSLGIAKANLRLYGSGPSSFPITQALTARPKPGTVFAYMQCSTPNCAQSAVIMNKAATELGVQLKVVPAGASASAVQQAMDSIVSLHPAAVLIPAGEPQEFSQQLATLAAKGIPVVSSGNLDTSRFPAIKANLGAASSYAQAGTLLADWTLTHSGDSPSVFYLTPEVSFSASIQAGFKSEMAKLCPTCQVRYVPVSLTTFGNTAPTSVVRDLQSHPSTRTAVFALASAAAGLPAALKVAGIKVSTVGFAPPSAELSYIKAGQLTAGLGLDSTMNNWAQVDAAARLVAGDPLPSYEQNGRILLDVLNSANISTLDIAMGYTAFPDINQRFAKLWATKR